MPVYAAPKPKRKPRAKRAHNSTLPLPQTPLPSRNPRRRAREYARCFHSKERVEFVKSLACIVARVALKLTCKGSIDNAHVVKDGTEGMGRKGGYKCIAPTCRHHHRCLHKFGPAVFEAVYGVHLEAEAAATESVWQAFKGEGE